MCASENPDWCVCIRELWYQYGVYASENSGIGMVNGRVLVAEARPLTKPCYSCTVHLCCQDYRICYSSLESLPEQRYPGLGKSAKIYTLKVCLKNWNLQYVEALERSNLLTITNRRQFSKLCILYNISNENIDFTCDPIHSICCMYDTRSNTSCKLIQPYYARTNRTPILQAQSQHGIYYPQIFLRLKL